VKNTSCRRKRAFGETQKRKMLEDNTKKQRKKHYIDYIH